MTSDFMILRSRNFTDKEAKVFIDEFEIDITRLEKNMDVANNLRILRIFVRTLNESERYDSCHMRYKQIDKFN